MKLKEQTGGTNTEYYIQRLTEIEVSERFHCSTKKISFFRELTRLSSDSEFEEHDKDAKRSKYSTHCYCLRKTSTSNPLFCGLFARQILRARVRLAEVFYRVEGEFTRM